MIGAQYDRNANAILIRFSDEHSEKTITLDKSGHVFADVAGDKVTAIEILLSRQPDNVKDILESLKYKKVTD